MEELEGGLRSSTEDHMVFSSKMKTTCSSWIHEFGLAGGRGVHCDTFNLKPSFLCLTFPKTP